MVERTPVNNIKNKYFNAAQLDANDLTLEQNYNDGVSSGLINNHIGSGVLPEVLEQKILFDSSLVVGLLDGIKIEVQNQPTDSNLGNQLEVELTDSLAAGKKTIKVAIIGLDFENNLQFDTLVFKQNEKQYTKKHYTQILTLLFNDLLGPTNKSFNLGGKVIIKEAKPITISRDSIMVSQDLEPNLFFRDFFLSTAPSLDSLLRTSLPTYNIDNLNINIGFKENKILAKNDVSTQIGEKFLATTNNIQKVSLLLSIQNTDPGQETDLSWHGDIIVSIYSLQNAVDCPTDIAPNLAIEFSPSNIPLAQLSFNYTTLKDNGILLDGNPQPVDFVFSNTLIASGNYIVPNSFYAITIKRSGSADKCDILIANGSAQIENSRLTTFTGTTWVDIPEDNLWFKIYTDAAKVSDGQAYESGHGIAIPKTNLDASTNATIDYCLDKLDFTGNNLYTAVLSSTIKQSGFVEDQRTGNQVASRQEYIPDVQLLNSIDLSNLNEVSDPLIIGLIKDKNNKSFDSVSATLSSNIHSWSFVKNTLILKIIDDITDGYRYDLTVNSLTSNLLNGDLVNAKLIPNANSPNKFYRISDAKICSMMYGDVNGDGIVNHDDLDLLNQLVGLDLNTSPPPTSQITDGYTTITGINGYNTMSVPFVNNFGISFRVVDPLTNIVKASGTDGVIVADPNHPDRANFQSASVDFQQPSYIIGNMNLVIFAASTSSNIGVFSIIATTPDTIDPTQTHILTIRKPLITPESIKQIMRADIDGDFKITSTDGYLLQSYINNSPPFPPTTPPSLNIGTRFTVLEFTVDPFLYNDISNTLPDRTDDFPASATNRSTTLHTQQDIYSNDGYFQSHDFKNHPAAFQIVKQLSWEDYLITANGSGKFVPSIFSSSNGLVKYSCELDGIDCTKYSDLPNFDPGKNDQFVPNDLIIGGQLVKETGDYYKVDFETGTITLEIPNTVLGREQVIDIFDYFVKDSNNTGITRLGYPALKFADCSYVQANAILNNQVRFAVSAMSFSPSLNGAWDQDDGYTGIIVDDRIGVYIDHNTGILRLNFGNLYQDPVILTMTTRIQISVYLKKAGFNNPPLTIKSDQMTNLLNLLPSNTPEYFDE